MARLDPAVAEVRRAVRLSLDDLDPGARLVVACSGGADSMALAAATVFEARTAGWLVGAAVVDHQLQEGSPRVARVVASRLQVLGCDPVEVAQVDVGARGGPEAAARAARYDALERFAERQGAVLLLGHTLDDQAETVILGLARGSGIRSLSGMSATTPRLRRPLLSLTRATTRQACAAMGLEIWEDPHNDDARFARVRVRGRVLPVLEAELGPGVAAALARTAASARQDNAALDELADALYHQALLPEGALEVAELARAAPALRRRALRLAALEAGCPPGELFAVHIDAVERLVSGWRGQGPLDLPGQVKASGDGHTLGFRRAGVGRLSDRDH
ncbi:MAG: tRNA lysidine(34) synthetase TilS [Nocardioidaceae bacterium]|nr:tRNA lysidine(34) synthetase TilS [Nocardioidaceae bacterium]